MATTTTFNGKKVHQGMIKSQKTRVGDFIIAFIIFLTMMICLLPMVNVLASSLSSSEHLIRNDEQPFSRPVLVVLFRDAALSQRRQPALRMLPAHRESDGVGRAESALEIFCKRHPRGRDGEIHFRRRAGAQLRKRNAHKQMRAHFSNLAPSSSAAKSSLLPFAPKSSGVMPTMFTRPCTGSAGSANRSISAFPACARCLIVCRIFT